MLIGDELLSHRFKGWSRWDGRAAILVRSSHPLEVSQPTPPTHSLAFLCPSGPRCLWSFAPQGSLPCIFPTRNNTFARILRTSKAALQTTSRNSQFINNARKSPKCCRYVALHFIQNEHFVLKTLDKWAVQWLKVLLNSWRRINVASNSWYW